MARKSLEQRVSTLEEQVEQLQTRSPSAKTNGKDWQATIGIFTGDDGMMEIFREAMKLREADRAKARRKSSKSRKRKNDSA